MVVAGACLIAFVGFLVGRGFGDQNRTEVGNGPASDQNSFAKQMEAPVLGDVAFSDPRGQGFGTVRPRIIDNGGVPSGLVEEINWQGWGDTVAYGTGLGYQYRPGGGYYDEPVEVRLRARRLDDCGDADSPAYTLLAAQFQEKPGGRFGDWFRWSGAKTICKW